MKYTAFLVLLVFSLAACNSSKMLEKKSVEKATTQMEKDKVEKNTTQITKDKLATIEKPATQMEKSKVEKTGTQITKDKVEKNAAQIAKDKNMTVEKTTTQMEKDKNLILQHAKDNNLDLKSTPSGIYYIMEKEGTGDAYPNMTSKIKAHYHGTLLNGSIFDSSVDRGEPLDFQLIRVIKGWQEAIPMLKKGGKGKFFIPSELAYGSRAVGGGSIPANSVLIFDIELVDFQ